MEVFREPTRDDGRLMTMRRAQHSTSSSVPCRRWFAGLALALAVIGMACGPDDGRSVRTVVSPAASLSATTVASSSESPAVDTEPSSGPFGDPEMVGMCAESEVALAADMPGASTQQDAIATFLRAERELAVVTMDGTSMFVDGRRVGDIKLLEVPAGGWIVELARWCY